MENIVPKDEEFIYEDSVIISQSDLNGNFTFVNRKFCEISAYKSDEVIGLNCNTLFHPDMPKAIFSKMFENIKGGQTWSGVIKNLRKDGLFYWSNLEVQAIIDNSNNITGYISVSRPASSKSVQESTELYKKMLQSEA